MKQRKEYKNKSEEAFCQFADSNGWRVTKRGWPDFFCLVQIAPNDFACVEVKRDAKNSLKKEQMFVARFLKKHGIPVYRWDAELKKLEDIDEAEARIRGVKL